MPNFNLRFSPEPPFLRATGVNDMQLPAALRKLRAAFRQSPHAANPAYENFANLPPAPPSKIHFVECSATLSRFPQAPSRFPSSQDAARLPEENGPVLPPTPPLIAPLRGIHRNSQQAFRKLQAAFRHPGMPTMY